MNFAPKYGHLDLVKFLCNNRTEGNATHAMAWASDFEQLEILQWHASSAVRIIFTQLEMQSRHRHLQLGSTLA